MKIICLMDNISHHEELYCQHGLSLYIETNRHKILLDTGANELFAANAQKLGVNLADVDLVFLSHGHYDHAGGISRFLEMNHTAKVYIKQEAFAYYIHEGKDGEEYIGIDNTILGSGDMTMEALEVHPQIIKVANDLVIDEELSLMTGVNGQICLPPTNQSLKKKTADGIEQDLFLHEQSLIITEGQKHILFSGCAHCGIINILDQYTKLFDASPNVAISGFHLERSKTFTEQQRAGVEQLASRLEQYPTQFYTCHCTGDEAYHILKEILRDQIDYLSVGEQIDL